MSLEYWILLIIGHSAGFVIAVLSMVGFIWRAIRGPSTFMKKLFNNKKRDTMPACLNDPTLGTHGFLHLEDVKIHYVSCGDEGKPLMLFAHGFPEFWYSWRYQMRYFAKDYRVVAYDMRGYGDSDKPSGYKNYNIEKLTKDIKQLVKALGYDSCVLAGHDWGGVVVWSFAHMYPDMVNQLIVMNTPHPVAFPELLKTNRKQLKSSWYIFFFQMPFIPEFMLKFNDYKLLGDMYTGKFGLKVGTMSSEDIEAYKYAFSKPGAATSALNYYRSSMKTDRSKRPKLPKFPNPVLCIWGCEDNALIKENAESARPFVDDMTVRYIQGASHWVQMDTPDQVNELMKEFLDSN